MRTTNRLGMAAVVVVAMLVGFAAPVSATDTEVEITSGTLSTVLGDFDLTPGSQGEGPCSVEDKEFELLVTTDADGTWSLDGTFGGLFQLPAGSGDWYQADFTIQAGSGGTWSGSAPTQGLAGIIAVSVTIYDVADTPPPPPDPLPPCDKEDPQCTITGVFGLDEETSTYKSAGDGLPATVAGDDITIDATTIFPLQTGSPCAPPWNLVGGTSASLDGLQATVL